MIIEDITINASSIGVNFEGDSASLFNNVDVSAPLCCKFKYTYGSGSATKINNSRFRVSEGGARGLLFDLGSVVRLTNVTVDVSAAGAIPALTLTYGSVVDLYAGQYNGSVTFNYYYGVAGQFRAAGTQLTAGVFHPSTKLINCFNGSFDPIP